MPTFNQSTLQSDARKRGVCSVETSVFWERGVRFCTRVTDITLGDFTVPVLLCVFGLRAARAQTLAHEDVSPSLAFLEAHCTVRLRVSVVCDSQQSVRVGSD